MKSRFLLAFAVVFMASITLSAQTFHIEWDGGSTIKVGSELDDVLKLEGTCVNDNGTPKSFLFTYNLAEANESHYISLCFKGGTGDQCFFLFPGEDDPTIRARQTLAPNGHLDMYCDLNPVGSVGTSIVAFELYDPDQPSERMPFTLSFYAGTTDVPEAQTVGFKVFPNPTSDVVTITPAEGMLVKGANLFAADGALLRSYPVSQSGPSTFSLSGLSAGTYQMILNLADGTTVRSAIVVQR